MKIQQRVVLGLWVAMAIVCGAMALAFLLIGAVPMVIASGFAKGHEWAEARARKIIADATKGARK